MDNASNDSFARLSLEVLSQVQSDSVDGEKVDVVVVRPNAETSTAVFLVDVKEVDDERRCVCREV